MKLAEEERLAAEKEAASRAGEMGECFFSFVCLFVCLS